MDSKKKESATVDIEQTQQVFAAPLKNFAYSLILTLLSILAFDQGYGVAALFLMFCSGEFSGRIRDD